MNRPGRQQLRAAAALLVLLALAAWGLWRALAEPSLGLRFEAVGDSVQARPVGGGVDQAGTLSDVRAVRAGVQRQPITPDLAIESPGLFHLYERQQAFFAAQRSIWALLQADRVVLEHAGGELALAPRPKGLDELGPRFWFPWAVGLLSLSVGLAAWVFQPGNPAARWYALAALGYGFGMVCTAGWGSRLLTQPPEGWPELHVWSHAATLLTPLGLCGLLWQTPNRLGGPWLPALLAAVAALSVAADALQWLPSASITFRLPAVLLTATVGLLFALQWRASRGDAVQRAQLKWFGLLLLASLSAVFVSYAIGTTGHVVPIRQNYGFGTVALLFIGLVPLVTRVGLFELEDWWPRAWLWLVGGLLVLAIDLALLTALPQLADHALLLALALAGWLYFPLRQWLWRRLGSGTAPSPEALLPRMVEVVAAAGAETEDAGMRWQGLWEELLRPAHIECVPPVTGARVEMLGQTLLVPGAMDLPALRLEGAGRGARLFNRADAQLADQVARIIGQALAAQRAREQGAREERQRIADDLHDDLGARLLSLAQSSESPTAARLAREAIDEMRLALRGLTGRPAPLEQWLADWRAETVARAQAAGLRCNWQNGIAPPQAALPLPAAPALQLARVLREAVSNVIRHAQAHALSVDWRAVGGALVLTVDDDGRGLAAAAGATDSAAAGHGHGLPGMQRRLARLGGQVTIEDRPGGGTRVQARMPLLTWSDDAQRIDR